MTDDDRQRLERSLRSARHPRPAREPSRRSASFRPGTLTRRSDFGAPQRRPHEATSFVTSPTRGCRPAFRDFPQSCQRRCG
jgi:hypothetical protein